jgi:hypothetical protein
MHHHGWLNAHQQQLQRQQQRQALFLPSAKGNTCVVSRANSQLAPKLCSLACRAVVQVVESGIRQPVPLPCEVHTSFSACLRVLRKRQPSCQVQPDDDYVLAPAQ